MSIIKAYNYFYYRVYLWQAKILGQSQEPELAAMYANSMCVFLNFITLINLIQNLTGYESTYDVLFPLISIAIVIFINYFYFIYGNRFKTIIDEYKLEDKEKRKTKTLWCWFYVILTFLTFLISLTIFSPR